MLKVLNRADSVRDRSTQTGIIDMSPSRRSAQNTIHINLEYHGDEGQQIQAVISVLKDLLGGIGAAAAEAARMALTYPSRDEVRPPLMEVVVRQAGIASILPNPEYYKATCHTPATMQHPVRWNTEVFTEEIAKLSGGTAGQ